MRPLSEQSDEQLEQTLKAAGSIYLSVGIIFGIIVLVWIIGGYWRQSIPAFISTVAMGAAITTMQFASMSGVRKELERRASTGQRD